MPAQWNKAAKRHKSSCCSTSPPPDRPARPHPPRALAHRIRQHSIKANRLKPGGGAWQRRFTPTTVNHRRMAIPWLASRVERYRTRPARCLFYTCKRKLSLPCPSHRWEGSWASQSKERGRAREEFQSGIDPRIFRDLRSGPPQGRTRFKGSVQLGRRRVVSA